jgi:hypothetical protein
MLLFTYTKTIQTDVEERELNMEVSVVYSSAAPEVCERVALTNMTAKR